MKWQNLSCSQILSFGDRETIWITMVLSLKKEQEWGGQEIPVPMIKLGSVYVLISVPCVKPGWAATPSPPSPSQGQQQEIVHASSSPGFTHWQTALAFLLSVICVRGGTVRTLSNAPTLSVCPFLAQICKDIRYECFEVRFLVTLTLPSSCAKLICCFAPLNLRCPWICSNLALIARLTSLDLSRPRLGHRYDHIDITET